MDSCSCPPPSDDKPCGILPSEQPQCNCGPPPLKCPERKSPDEMPRIPLNEVRRFMYDCLVASGAAPEIASIQSDVMLYADYTGVSSHGINHLESFCKDIKSKRIRAKEYPEIISDTGACAFIDGKATLGGVVGTFCIDLAVKKAKTSGVAVVVAKNSSIFGDCSFYTERALKSGMMSLVCSNSAPQVVPTRAKDVALGTNPLSFAAPISICDRFLLDMTTSAVTTGTLELYRQRKQEVPVGWIQDECGEHVKDPYLAVEIGRLLPLGGSEPLSGYKGLGLIMMVDILSGILAGADFGPKVKKMAELKDKETYNMGHFFMVINPAFFCPGFQERLKWYVNFVRNVKPLDPDNPVVIPGDLEKKHQEEIDLALGIQYTKLQMGQCMRLAQELKVKPLLEVKPNV